MPELIMPARYRHAHYKGFMHYLQTGMGPVLGTRIELTAIRMDGAEFPVELSIVPHGSRQKPIFTAYLRDITERKRAEKELHDAIDREQERAEQLREADRRKDEFLAMLAHELRNPLAAVANSLQIARTPGIGQNALRWSQEVMERQVSQLTRLIDDLLDVSRITRGKITLRKEVVPLEPLLRRAADAVQSQFDAKRQTLSLHFPDRDTPWIDVDPARIEQILGNLLTNAMRYTPDGGQIAVEAALEGDEVVVRVSDDGIGIAPEMLPLLFEPFAQADSSLDRAHGGLGIGLTLVRSLAEMHGGTASAASEGIGRGSVFTLRLPIAQNPVQSTLIAQPKPTGDSRRVLVVDDNYDAASTLAMVLQYEEFVTSVVGDGAEAIRAVEKLQPEIVLLDIGLPGIDGYEVARRVRELPSGGDILLIAITGYGQPGDRARAFESGFDHHLVKPVDTLQLIDLCANFQKREVSPTLV
jgi:signal transduction histidine kinase/CheY-like chemotaxis protein